MAAPLFWSCRPSCHFRPSVQNLLASSPYGALGPLLIPPPAECWYIFWRGGTIRWHCLELCKLGRSDISRADNTGWSAQGPWLIGVRWGILVDRQPSLLCAVCVRVGQSRCSPIAQLYFCIQYRVYFTIQPLTCIQGDCWLCMSDEWFKQIQTQIH